MRTFLVNLPWEINGRFGVRAGSRWPFTSLPASDGRIHYIPFPFFLAYAAVLLKNKLQEAKLLDAIAEEISESKLIEIIGAYNPTLIVVETSTPSFQNDMKIIDNIGQKFNGVKIALCGPPASVFPEQILKEHNFIDYILFGEYEYTLLDLVERLEGDLSLRSVPGLAYREDGGIRKNDYRAEAKDLDSLPWPEREDLPIYKYNDGFCNLPVPNVQIWSSRGCPFGCVFCLWPQTMYAGYKYRMRNPLNVVDEMEYLINKFNFQAVYFDDDLFNANKEHVLAICKEIKKRGIEIPWAVMARADLMDRELLESMRNSGLYAIKYGIESANQGILDFCKKKMDLSVVSKMVSLTKQLGIKVHLTFCLGLPGETKETIKETSRFMHHLKPDSFQFSLATPFPGTQYYGYLEKNGLLLSNDWPDYDGNYKYIVNNPGLNALDMKEIRDALNNNRNF